MIQMYQKNKGFKDSEDDENEKNEHVCESSFSQVLINN